MSEGTMLALAIILIIGGLIWSELSIGSDDEP